MGIIKMYIGSYTKPLLIFGGPYSNLQATIALRQQAETLNIPPSHIICTGDIVAYCGQPFETVEFIREWGIHVLMGNCEESFATNSNNCGCGFTQGSSCDLLSAQWFHYANQQITQAQRQWFANLPRTLTFNFVGKKIQVVHGSVTSINQFLFASNKHHHFEQEFNHTDANMIIAGHCGIPFTKNINNKLWHNAGAIGMPANDGSLHTWFSLVSYENKTIKIATCPLYYDHELAVEKMQLVGLNNGYTQALSTGLWPSIDILPPHEGSLSGNPLKPTINHW